MRKFIHLFEDWKEPPGAEAIERREALLARMDDVDIGIVDRYHLEEVRRDRYDYVLRMVRSMRRELRLINKVKSAPGLLELLHLMRTAEGTGEIVARRQFEAMAIFDLAIMFAYMEGKDPQPAIGRSLWLMNDLLERVWIDRDSVSINFWSHHDPADQFRVALIDQGARTCRSGLVSRKHPLPLRKTKSGIPFLFDQRDKDVFQVILKIWKQVVHGTDHDPFTVRDRLAFRIVGLSEEQTAQLLEEFRSAVMGEGARCVLDVDNGENANSKGYRAKKMFVTFRGLLFEFQFVTLQNDLNAEYALGEENHDLYKLRQALEYYLPLLYPVWAYQTVESWEDTELQAELTRHMIQRIGWSHRLARLKRASAK